METDSPQEWTKFEFKSWKPTIPGVPLTSGEMDIRRLAACVYREATDRVADENKKDEQQLKFQPGSFEFCVYSRCRDMTSS